MQSKMTEREFREVLRVAVATGFDDAVKRAREAGLEFAPEPVEPPVKLACGPAEDGEGPADFYLYPAELRSWKNRQEKAAAYRLARDRYNAYPGLWAAAERVRLASILPAGALPARLNLALCELVAELAKGPK